MKSIPKIIHLIGAEKVPPAKYRLFVDRIRSLHPGWKIEIWDDVSALAIVHEYFPELTDMYLSYLFTVQRTDIFRILITYLYGGFYMDMDMLCFKSVDELCGYELVLGVEKILSQSECAGFDHKYNTRIANYMFASQPHHKFWLEVLHEAEKRQGKIINVESDILETTGPGLLTEVFHSVRDNYDNIKLLYNHERPCPKSCGPASCHFGDFAVHQHMGSWRWENTGNDQMAVENDNNAK
jgi:inositol phosphorylceramide mannosyltransferase catalytic subunit